MEKIRLSVIWDYLMYLPLLAHSDHFAGVCSDLQQNSVQHHSGRCGQRKQTLQGDACLGRYYACSVDQNRPVDVCNLGRCDHAADMDPARSSITQSNTSGTVLCLADDNERIDRANAGRRMPDWKSSIGSTTSTNARDKANGFKMLAWFTRISSSLQN